MAASICSGVLRLLLLCLFSAACRAWKNETSSRISVASSLAAQRASRAERDRLPKGSPKGERGGAHQRAGKFRHHLHPALFAVFLFEDVFLSGGDERQAFGGFAGGPLVPVEAVHQVAGDAVLLQHHGDGLGGVKGRVPLAAALGVGDERFLELIGEAEVIHHQATRLVAEDAVHAGDGLHEAMALHRLVGTHGVQAGRVEAGQPHVSHDHDLEGVFGVLEPIRQVAPGVFAADVFLPIRAVLRAAGHHDLQRIFRPLGPQLDKSIEKIHADAAAHADDHRLAVHRLHALLEMRHQVGGHQRDAFRIAHQCLQRGPFGLELFLLRQLLAFGDFLELRIQLRQLGGVQAEFGNPALVVDRHRGLVGDGALDVVDADVIAEDRPHVRIRLFDGRAGEADERRIRQGIAQVAGEAVGHLAGLSIHLAAEPILAAVRFIRDDDDVLPRAQLGHRLALFRNGCGTALGGIRPEASGRPLSGTSSKRLASAPACSARLRATHDRHPNKHFRAKGKSS